MEINEKLAVEDYYSILDNLHDGVYFVDKNRIITYWNKGAERISGFLAEEVIGRSCADSILTHIDCDGNLLCREGCPLIETLDKQNLQEAHVYMHHKDGHRIPVFVRTSPLLDDQGELQGGIEIFTDISNQEGNELRIKELEKLALLDTLTNLANRRYTEQEIESRMAEFRRMGIPFGLLFMDIDHFKHVNDTYGHDVGDEVLRFVANTFISSSRPFDLYGRWGGEEFIGIIRNVDEKQLSVVGERIRKLIEASYIIHNEQQLRVTISIGATLVREGDEMTNILSRADEFLYMSKNGGRNLLTMG